MYRRRGHPQYCATFAPSSLAANGWPFVETVDEQRFHPDTVRVIERDVGTALVVLAMVVAALRPPDMDRRHAVRVVAALVVHRQAHGLAPSRRWATTPSRRATSKRWDTELTSTPRRPSWRRGLGRLAPVVVKNLRDEDCTEEAWLELRGCSPCS